LVDLDRDRPLGFLTFSRLVLSLGQRRTSIEGRRPALKDFGEAPQLGRKFGENGVIGGGIAHIVEFGADRRLI